MRNEPSVARETTAAPGFCRAELEALYAAHERPLFNVALRWTWNAEDAAEIVQEAFARVWSMRARVDPSRAKSLLFRIAVNLAASKRRWRQIRHFVGLEKAERTSTPPLVEANLIAQQRWSAVRVAVDALPETLRRTLVLCELSRLSHAEVARITGTKIGTVGSRRHEALRRVRASLAEQHGDADG